MSSIRVAFLAVTGEGARYRVHHVFADQTTAYQWVSDFNDLVPISFTLPRARIEPVAFTPAGFRPPPPPNRHRRG